MSGKHSRDKGARFEREIVNYLKSLGYEAERIPLSGAMGTFKGDVQVRHGDKTFKIECKSLANGFKFIYESLGDNDALCIRADRQEPLLVLRLGQFLRVIEENIKYDIHNR